MKPGTYDKFLIRLAILGPLALIALSQWQASLLGWYEPWGTAARPAFGQTFSHDVSALPGVSTAQNSLLFFIADTDCPCTKTSLAVLQNALQKSRKENLELVVVDVNTARSKDPAWARVLQQIPSTPTLLITDKGKLLYAGPVNSGNFCTTRVKNILGLSALEAAPTQPVLNRLEKGCYCAVSY